MKEVRNLKVLVSRAADLPGQWLGHCLDLDLMSQGNSIDEAMESMVEIVSLAMVEDLKEGLDPFQVREGAPEACWQEWMQITATGRPLSALTADQVSSVRALAVQVQLELEIKQQPSLVPLTLRDHMQLSPPAWQLAALDKLRDSQHCIG